jgi:predicted Rossmann fold flavoprotein
MQAPIIIIGAGGAGIIAAWKASSEGADVMLLERNGRPGVKILISGGGKCNVTHDGDIESLLNAFTIAERRFLKPSFHRFDNAAVVKLLTDEGINTETRENGRVFPMYGNAKDVMRVLNGLLQRGHVQTRMHTQVSGILAENGTVTGVRTESGDIATDHVILATGGSSYPRTGTTGDGYRWASVLGHTVVPIRPALAPIVVKPAPPREWQGVPIRDCRLSAVFHGRRIASWDGDMLFTHEGLSGPCALEISREAAKASDDGPVSIVLDVLPAQEFEDLDRTIGEAILANRQRIIGKVLEAWLPNRLVAPFLTQTGVDPLTRGHVITREARRAIVHKLKEWTLGTVERIPLERGEVTAGGIALNEVDPRTMRSRIIGGLYPCGEVLDIAGPIGGYNLQAAFSTGYVAGETAACDWKGVKN